MAEEAASVNLNEQIGIHILKMLNAPDGHNIRFHKVVKKGSSAWKMDLQVCDEKKNLTMRTFTFEPNPEKMLEMLERITA